MTELVRTSALLVTVAALVSGAAALACTRSVRVALPVFLDMLLAAGLLRLVVHPGGRQLAAAAALVVVKRLATSGIVRSTVSRKAA